MNPSRLPFAARFVRQWVRLYTLGLPPTDRDARLAEIESDIWEEVDFARGQGKSSPFIGFHICNRLLLGVPMDLSWRIAGRGAERDALGRSARTLQQKGGALGLALRSRLAVGAMLVTGALFLTAGSVTAIRDQITVGDRVDTPLAGIGLSNLDAHPHYADLPRIELTSFVPHLAVKARTRRGDTVTALPDGRVLVVGDLSSPGNRDGARVYRPSRNAWQSTAYLADKRRWHTSTLLLDGRVLVTGGREISGKVLHTVEIFDPLDDTWTSTSVMHHGRAHHAAALLNDGRVLVVGGFDSDLRTLTSAEVYDPATQTWALVGHMSEARSVPTASVLHDGRVLVSGGSHTGAGSAAMRNTAEMYNPITNSWKSAGRFEVNRAGHSATVLRDGRVLVVGGAGPASTVAKAEMYDPDENAWYQAGSLALSRTGHSAAMMSDGRIIVAGGWSNDGSAGHLVELFDPRVGTWLTMAVSP
jgi:N-acetylneuraminic acid mutarotase